MTEVRSLQRKLAPDTVGSDKRKPTSLQGIAMKAKADKKHRFRDLYRLLNTELLISCWPQLNKNAASGVDGVTWEAYGKDLHANVEALVKRLKSKRYRARLILRHYIPKENGKRRPLGIPVIEDKLLQAACAKIITAIYEQEFHAFSYGYRPERGAGDAVRDLTFDLQYGCYGYVVEADIKGFFDHMGHEWLWEMLSVRIDDRAFLGLIRKWLKAGILETDGKVIHPDTGTPQGGVISPVLANVYLHYVLDQWVAHERQSPDCGDVVIVRYADDFVLGFQHKATAERFLQALRQRFAEYGLTLHPDKTRLIEFGRFAASNRAERGEGKPETFDFLGFTHICSTTRRGGFFLKRITIGKRLRKKVKAVAGELRKRMHRPVIETAEWLRSVLRGHGQYYGVPGNSAALKSFYDLVAKAWHKVLRRRSQKGRRLSWEKFNRIKDACLPHIRICHPFPDVRFDATHSRQEPYAVVPHVRICAGGAG